jgi:site-specific DNA recombinase
MQKNKNNRLLVQMQGVIAEYERAKIIERTRRGRKHKLSTGQSIPYTGTAPYGYAIVRHGDQKVVVIDEVQAVHVRLMFRWVVEEGLSSRAVAKRLNELGIPPPRTKYWSQGTAYSILTNPAYIGLATYNRHEITEPKRPRNPGSYRKEVKSSTRLRPKDQWLYVPIPALVDKSVQNQVRKVLSAHKVRSPRNVKYGYLLQTLVVCGKCGWRMECNHQKSPIGNKTYEYFYYACRHKDPLETGRQELCDAKRVRRDELDTVVWNAIVSWVQSPDILLKQIEAWQSSRAISEQIAHERTEAQKGQRRIEFQIERLIDAYQVGAICIEELKARRERLEASLDAARTRVEQLKMVLLLRRQSGFLSQR